MTALSDYDPQTHDPRPILLVAPWQSEKRAREYIARYDGTYVTGSFEEVHNTRIDHVVIEDGHHIQYDFEKDLQYVVIDEAYDCYDQIHSQWRDAQ